MPLEVNIIGVLFLKVQHQSSLFNCLKTWQSSVRDHMTLFYTGLKFSLQVYNYSEAYEVQQSKLANTPIIKNLYL